MTVFSNVHGFNGAYTIKQSSLQLMMLVSGIMTVTTKSMAHGMVTGNRVQVCRETLSDSDVRWINRKTIKSYPRRKDPADQNWLSVTTTVAS